MAGDSGECHHYWLLDRISVTGTASNTNILINGGFEMGNFTGWTQYCATDANCGGTGTNYGQLTTSSCKSGTYCYVDKCDNGGHFDYLVQSFPTVIGNYYSVAFYLKIYSSGGSDLAYVMVS
ncbi:unnamed protein product [Rotaria sp. Silwood2]|nr:unnamed protein product [Rotaria sp. Silwood2]CAF3125073.1 unnamed protein product [Rotaria sp. Silwood2]CAF3367934.1 unnamed protein product [Rotaria sp. Silwood2]CAF4023543.1 unnamed protein product [Rotaria sp. Silwood2]CAF4231962.1 unnamed protein product [Rotaria sp. Silwood2]